MTSVLLVAAGAVIGALVRYLAEVAGLRRGWTGFPWATFAVNVGGSFVLGLLAGLATSTDVSADVVLLIGVGFCGTATTFSTFALQAVTLRRSVATTYVAASVVGGVAACFAGYGFGSLG
jgi:fluoride exporter